MTLSRSRPDKSAQDSVATSRTSRKNGLVRNIGVLAMLLATTALTTSLSAAELNVAQQTLLQQAQDLRQKQKPDQAREKIKGLA